MVFLITFFFRSSIRDFLVVSSINSLEDFLICLWISFMALKTLKFYLIRVDSNEPAV